jgi:serine protease AprX
MTSQWVSDGSASPQWRVRQGAVLIFAAFLTVVMLVASDGPAKIFPGLGKVDQRVLEDTNAGKTGSFLIVLANQADLRAAPDNAPENLRVSDIYTRLRRVADDNQAGVISVLDRLSEDPALRVRYQSFWLVDTIAVDGTRAAVDALAALPAVVRIDSNRSFKAASSVSTAMELPESAAVEPNLVQIGAPKLWSRGVTGQGIVYANADTGVQWDHPALKNQYRGWNSKTGTVDHDYNWWDAVPQALVSASNPCVYQTQAPCDDAGHGTHTMGIGVGDDGHGNQIGVAPGSRWIACRNMADGVGQPSAYIGCLQFLMAPTDLTGNNPRPDLHADVISNSYSCPVSEGCTAPDVLHEAVEAVRTAGIFMSVSVGNLYCDTRSGTSTIEPPAVEPDVFTVGAVNSANALANFSSRGPTTYMGISYLKPDLVAPGVGIRSSLPVTSVNRPDPYGSKDGTSMAAPHVAGAVALLWSAHPELRGKVSETEQILEMTAHPLNASAADLCNVAGPTGSPNDAYGYGLLDVSAAYNSLLKYLNIPLVLR